MANDLELYLKECLTAGDFESALRTVHDLLTQVEMSLEDPELSPAEREELESRAFQLYSQSIDLRAVVEELLLEDSYLF